jgi:hypothetical protein
VRSRSRNTPARFLAVCVLALLFLPGLARAEIVVVDLDSPGDGLIKRDTETGLDWLDLSAPVPPGNFLDPGYSIDDILAGAGGWLGRGFRYATTSEVCGYFEHLGLVPDPCPGPFTPGWTQPIIAVIGESACCPGQTVNAFGRYDDGGLPALYGRAGYRLSLSGSSGVVVEEDAIGVGDPDRSDATHLLVRTSPGAVLPVPSLAGWAQAVLLLGLGLSGVARSRSVRVG